MNNIEDIYELSPMQQGMLFHTLYAPESEVYFEQLLCILSGELNFTAFQQAWEQVVARHPVLRSSFYWEEIEKPLQMVSKQVDLPWEKLDWRNFTPDEQQQQLEDFLSSDRQKGFELDVAPLMRFTVTQLEDYTYQFIWSHHHILFDGWSMQIILKEVLVSYEAHQRGEHLRLLPSHPYREYIEWLQQQDIVQAKNFWQEALQGFEAPTPLRVDKSTLDKSRQQPTYDEKHFQLSQTVTEKLQYAARKHHLTLNNLVQGAWALLLSSYSGESDVVFGATVSGRPPTLAGVDSMVGLLINTLPVRVQITANAEFLPWLKQLQSQAFEQEQYAYYSLAEIQRLSDIPPGMPLFESLLVFENYPLDSAEQDTKKTLEISHLRCLERTNYPLTLVVNPESQLSGRIVYDTSRFEQETIARMIGHFQTLLASIVANPQPRVQELSLVSATEQHQLLAEWNNTQSEYPQDQCIDQLFEAQVERTPDAIALVFEKQQLTYQELNSRANQLAHYLRGLGVGTETLVGICVERSIEMVVGLLGILKAGGAYVPLDPTYPQERLALILSDAQLQVLLTSEKLIPILPKHNALVVLLDRAGQAISQEKQYNVIKNTKPTNLAYILYTSGSTGQPKGVAVEHRSTVNFLHWAHEVYTLEQIAGVLASTSINFDLSVFELFVPLCWGGRVILAENALHLPILADKNITLINTVPSVITELLRINGIPDRVQIFNLAGEPLSHQLVQQLYQHHPSSQVFNLYGPTEATTYATFTLVQKGGSKSPTIGRPLANTQIYILDSHLQPVPIGVVGELYIGGAGLARDYLHRPDLTSEKFIFNPFSNQLDARLYKTGDLARYLSDGNIEFLGRRYYQVKIRGFRIELLEIEAVLAQHPMVQETMVLVREYATEQRLVAYVVPQQEPPVPSTLRNFLKEKLPEYMIPVAFVFLEAFPLTPNGKRDRRALPTPDISQRSIEVDFVPPRTPTEHELASIWLEVLRLKQVGVQDNFFELGGHSLLGIEVISQLREAFSLDFPLRYLFENPTIAELAQKVIAQQIEQAENDALAQILEEVDQLSQAEVTQQLIL